MVDERGLNVNNANHHEVERISLISNAEKLRIHLFNRTEPIVFDGAARQWTCLRWTPEFLASEVGDLRTRFRFCSRANSSTNELSPYKKAIMETDCEFEEASFGEFFQWLNGNIDKSGSLSHFQRQDFWCYADYKYMAELFEDFPHLRQAVNWSCFGFPERSGDESTIWIGSAEASTPCHIDTYGCNLVAQIYGRKKWTLFPPSETPNLYPTRIPYEESSVFSRVNVTSPDLRRFPAFATVVKYEVILQPGDVLFVPKKWWHYVESLETSISINTWIELESDHIERVKEAMIRTLVCALKKEDRAPKETWVNPSEEIGTHKQNMGYLHQALSAVKHKIGDDLMGQSDSNEANLDVRKQRDTDKNILLSTDDLINCITVPEVINEMTVQVLQKIGISKTSDLQLESWLTQDKNTVPPSEDNSDRPCHGLKTLQFDQSVKTQSSDEWKIQKHSPCKRICIERGSNKE